MNEINVNTSLRFKFVSNAVIDCLNSEFEVIADYVIIDNIRDNNSIDIISAETPQKAMKNTKH